MLVLRCSLVGCGRLRFTLGDWARRGSHGDRLDIVHRHRAAAAGRSLRAGTRGRDACLDLLSRVSVRLAHHARVHGRGEQSADRASHLRLLGGVGNRSVGGARQDRRVRGLRVCLCCNRFGDGGRVVVGVALSRVIFVSGVVVDLVVVKGVMVVVVVSMVA